MHDGTARVGVAAGPGLVGRFGDAVILIAGDAAAGPVGELLDILEGAVAEAEPPGAVIAARLAGWVGSRLSSDETAFGVVAPVADGVVVFLRGPMWAEVVTPESTVRLSGRRALTWVDHVVPVPFERLAVSGGGEEPVQVHPRSALRAGVVPAQGFVLTPSSGEPAGTPARAEQPAVPRPAKSTPPERLEVPSPRETVGTPRREVTLADRPVLEHPVDVRETAMAPPPVGALVSEGGPTVVLDRSYVLGREPQNDPAVQSAAASPIVVRDPDHLVSRVHARVSVEDGSVYVRDAPSVSGTFVAAPGAEDWTRVGTEPTQLLPDWSLRIGKRVFVFKATRATEPDRG